MYVSIFNRKTKALIAPLIQSQYSLIETFRSIDILKLHLVLVIFLIVLGWFQCRLCLILEAAEYLLVILLSFFELRLVLQNLHKLRIRHL